MAESTERAAATAPGDSSITRFFDDVSSKRNELFRAHASLEYEQQVRARAVHSALDAGPGDTILDIGCGNARDILPLLKTGATVVGVDLSQGMLAQAKLDLAAAGYREVTLEVGDATKLGFADATFDKIVCSEAIEHIPAADEAIREMFRVLRPGGTLVLSTPNRTSWYGFDRYVLWTLVLRRKWNHPYDEWRSMAELSALVERQGFRAERKTSVCYLPGFIAPYFLPGRLIQRLLVVGTKLVEPLAIAVAPWRGYTIVVTARKPA